MIIGLFLFSRSVESLADRLGNLDVLNRHAGEIGDRDLIFCGASRNSAVDDLPQFEDVLFLQLTGLEPFADFPPFPALGDTVGNHQIRPGKNIRIEFLFERCVRTHGRDMGSRSDQISGQQRYGRRSGGDDQVADGGYRCRRRCRRHL